MNISNRLEGISNVIEDLQTQNLMLRSIVYQQKVITTFLINNFSPAGFTYIPSATVRLKDGSIQTVHYTSPSFLSSPSIKQMYDHTIISSPLEGL